jgi:hypothetical protein
MAPQAPSPAPRTAGKTGLFKALPLKELAYQVQSATTHAPHLCLRINGPAGEQVVTLDKTAYTLGGHPRGQAPTTHIDVGDPELASDGSYLLWNQATWELELHTSEQATSGFSVKRKSGRGFRTTLVAPGKALALKPDDRLLAGASELSLLTLD